MWSWQHCSLAYCYSYMRCPSTQSLCQARGCNQERTARNIRALLADGLAVHRTDSRLARNTCVIHTPAILVDGVILFVIFSAIDVEVRLSQTLVIRLLTRLTLVPSLTPVNLGIREGLIASSAHFLRIPAAKAPLAALIDRTIAVILTFAIGLFFCHRLLRGMSLSEEKA